MFDCGCYIISSIISKNLSRLLSPCPTKPLLSSDCCRFVAPSPRVSSPHLSHYYAPSSLVASPCSCLDSIRGFLLVFLPLLITIMTIVHILWTNLLVNHLLLMCCLMSTYGFCAHPRPAIYLYLFFWQCCSRANFLSQCHCSS
ncbi:hypothetical protein D1007_38437 [Hordeum vulgare]|nr:hypothetical protein D1007_38437 [Hordeum vulgare]